MGERRHPPNRLLAWERLQRGWSYEEITERVRAEMTRCGETDTGLTANTVRRWETGERWPDPRYRKHLVTIFAKPASELGLLTPDELASPAGGNATRVQEEVGCDCRTTRRDGPRHRVTRFLGAGALPFLAPLLALGLRHTDARRGKLPTPSRTDDRPLPPAPVLDEPRPSPVRGRVRPHPARRRASCAAPGEPRGPRRRRRESALLTARLAFFDLSQAAVADRCFDVALPPPARPATMRLAAAVIGTCRSSRPSATNPTVPDHLLGAAFQHTWHGVSPPYARGCTASPPK